MASFGSRPSWAAVGELADRLRELLALELGEPQDAAAAALDVEQRVAVAQQDVGAGACATGRRPPSRFGQGSDAP